MSALRLILLSLRHFWKMNVAVACGVAVGTAVLTGALLVGDSMQGSLRDLVLAGLGNIDEVARCRPFLPRAAGRRRIRQDAAGAGHSRYRQRWRRPTGESPAASIRSISSVATSDSGTRSRRQFVQTAAGTTKSCSTNRWPGCWRSTWAIPCCSRFAKPGAIPAESALGRKRARWIRCGSASPSVIPAEGLGRFGLRPNQRALAQCLRSLARIARRNFKSRAASTPSSAPRTKYRLPWHPATGRLRHPRRSIAAGLYRHHHERLIFAPAVEQALLETTSRPRCAAGPDLSGQLDHARRPRGALFDDHRHRFSGPSRRWDRFFPSMEAACAKLADDEIALNDWAAERAEGPCRR